MKNFKAKLILVFFVSLILGALIGIASAFSTMDDGTCICDSCGDCHGALNSNYCLTTTYLDADISSSGTCINHPTNFNNKVFDCQGHTITGSGPDEGIYLNYENSYNTIKNCIITNFSTGIEIYSPTNTTLTNNTVNDNWYDGIALINSNNNIITENTINNNHNIGIYSSNSNSTINNNRVCGNIQSDFSSTDWLSSSGEYNACDKPDGWNDIGATGCTRECNSFLYFIYPTPANNTAQCQNFVEINTSIETGDLNTFKFNWDGNDYNFYDDSLVLSLCFNNNSNIGDNDTYAVDVSSYENNGTIHNGASYVDGKYGKALQFDGSNDYVDCGNDSSLNITDAITVEAWVKPSIVLNSSQSYRMIVTKYQYQHGYGFSYISGSVRFNIYNPNAVSVNYPVTLQKEWYHLVATKDSSSMNIYMNGKLVATQAENISIASSSQHLLIGSWSSQPGNYVFPGTIDEVKIYNRALSANEIKMHYYSNLYKYNTTQWYFYTNITLPDWKYYNFSAWANDTAGNQNSTGTYYYTDVCQCKDVFFNCPSNGWKDLIVNNSGCRCGFKNGKISDYDFTGDYCEYNLTCNPSTNIDCYGSEGIPLYVILALGSGGFASIYYYWRRKRRRR